MTYYIEALVDGKPCNFYVNAENLDDLHDRASDAIERFCEEIYPNDQEACDNCYCDSTYERIFVRIW